MKKKELMKLLGIIVIGLITAILLNVFNQKFNLISYFFGVAVAVWIWFVEDNY